MTEIQDSIFSPPAVPHGAKLKRLAANRGSWMIPGKMTKPPQLSARPEGDTEGLFRLYSRKILDLAREKNIQFVLVHIPSAPGASGFENEAQKNFAAEAERAGGTVIVPEVRFEEGDYSFSRHLTEEGARKLTGYLAPALQKCR